MVKGTLSPCGFDLGPNPLSLTLSPSPRQQAGRWRETLTRCIRAWCCVRRTGNRACPLPWQPRRGRGSSPSLHTGQHWQLWSPSFPRLDEDGKVLTPEELLYRVGGAMGGAGLPGWQLGGT